MFGFTVSKDTLNCMQNTLMQYLVIVFFSSWRCICLNVYELDSAVSFENSFCTILPGLIVYKGYNLGTCMAEFIKPRTLPLKSKRTDVLH